MPFVPPGLLEHCFSAFGSFVTSLGGDSAAVFSTTGMVLTACPTQLVTGETVPAAEATETKLTGGVATVGLLVVTGSALVEVFSLPATLTGTCIWNGAAGVDIGADVVTTLSILAEVVADD